MGTLTYLFFCAAAYLLGSVPFGFVVAKSVRGIDIREHGSRNVGATNVFRVVGKQWGILVLLLDTLKGFAAVRLPEWIMRADLFVPGLIGFGLAAILGHTFSVWLSFKGGKGVATSLGVFLAIAWMATLITFLLWIIIFSAFRIISLASLAAAFLFPVVVFFCYQGQIGFGWLMCVSVFLGIFIVWTHRGNIQRLIQGEEKRLF